MPTRKPVAKSSKASKPVATQKPAKRKPVARPSSIISTTAKSRPPVAKLTPRKAAASLKDSVPKTTAPKAALITPAKTTPVKPTAVVTAPTPIVKPAAKAARTATPKTLAAPETRAAAQVVTAVAVRTFASVLRHDANLGPSPSSGDEEGDEVHNLLAGPRNVKPYIVKRGEQYMNKEQTEHFRKILLAWKRDLMVEVDRTVSHMKDEAANFPDPNDRATQEEEFSLELRTRDRERKLIRKIEEAIKRIEDGSYGYCLETGEEIGVKRLEARPVATLSLEAQERRERREKQYGDRDDRYR